MVNVVTGAEIPLATEAELDVLPSGLYQVADTVNGAKVPRRETKQILDLFHDEVVTGPAVLLARVREDGEIPDGIASITIRSDGHQIITAWVRDGG